MVQREGVVDNIRGGEASGCVDSKRDEEESGEGRKYLSTSVLFFGLLIFVNLSIFEGSLAQFHAAGLKIV